MMQPIKNERFEIIAWVHIDPDGRKDLRDAQYRIIGYYDPSVDRTYDGSLRWIGDGDLLMTLVPR